MFAADLGILMASAGARVPILSPGAIGDLSLVGFAIQMAGIGALAGLFYLLDSAVRRPYFRIWSQAFLAMAIALVSLKLAFQFPRFRWGGEALYYFGEYAFAFFLHQGFTRYPNRDRGNQLPPWFVVAGVALVAVLLAGLPGNFLQRFGLHALLFGVALSACLPAVRELRQPPEGLRARTLTMVALGALSLDFLANGIVGLWLRPAGSAFAASYSAYQSIVDLFFEVLLAFCLVALATVDVRRSLEAANQVVQGDRDRLAMLAHTDPLTGCFNRRALDELRGRIGERSGLVAVLDLNRLKTINDTLGHAAGDAAICFTAQCLKTLLRSHDHLFRVGGDEFVLVAFHLPQREASRRFEALQEKLCAHRFDGGDAYPLSISWGLAWFGKDLPLEASMARADAAMYTQKQHQSLVRV